jgi:hypothetical protein
MTHEELRELWVFMSSTNASYGIDRYAAESLLAEYDNLHAENEKLRSQVAAALVADGQWMERTGELRKQVARLRSLLARYREHVVAHESIDYLGHRTGLPPLSFLRGDLALSADEADEIRAIAAEEIPNQLPIRD